MIVGKYFDAENIRIIATDGVLPLSNGSVSFREFGSDSPATIYKDRFLTAIHPNPIALDADGALPPVYLNGQVEATAFDSKGKAWWSCVCGEEVTDDTP